MNTTELPVRPDVAAFVAQVRALLGDLSEEERLELTEGLEADLADQVAERGGGALGDPEAYARELRAAAGFDPVPRRRLRTHAPRSYAETLDEVRAGWETLVSRPRIALMWTVLVALRPAWWAVRAWAAAVVVARLVPGWYDYGFVWLPGVHPVLALVILAACLAGSALVGLGKVWPGGERGTPARTVLLLLNVAAVVALPVINGQLDQQSWSRYSEGYANAQLDDSGLGQGVVNRGEQVCNIAAYDADGQPLTGVQLFDQAGRSLDVRCYGQENEMVPWVLGDVTRWNVFPIGERAVPARRPAQREDLEGAAFPVPDRATAPAVTNPLVPAEVEPEGSTDRSEKKDRRGEQERERERERVSRR